MTHLEKLYRQVSQELEVPLAEVERLCRYQFLFVVEQAALPIPQQVRLPRFGSFQPMQWAMNLHQRRLAAKALRELNKESQAHDGAAAE